MCRVVIAAVMALAMSAVGQAAGQLPPPPEPGLSQPEPRPQLPPPPGPTAKPPAPAPTPTPQAPRPSPTPEQPPRKIRGRDLNVQIELTITDQIGSATPEKKVVSMVAADATFGRIRSNSGFASAVLNVDVRPQLMDADRIFLEITVEYAPPLPENTPQSKRPAALNESLSVILQAGKPMMISQAADPVNDRKMTVEVRALIAK